MLGAVYDYVLKFTPDAKEENIFRGYENRTALPNTQEYIVISIQDSLRVGTNVYKLSKDEDTIKTLTLRQYVVDIEFCNVNQTIAQKQAEAIENVSYSYLAVDFFKKYDIAFNHSDDVEYVPFENEQNQYIHRYRVPIYFTKWEDIDFPQDYFTDVHLRIEDIDTHHKP